MMASTLNKCIYKEQSKWPKIGEFILKKYDNNIENKELSFNIGL